MTYTYTGPSTLAIIGIAVISSVVTAGVLYALWWLEGWWLERRQEPGPIDPGVDGVMLEPHDEDRPFPDGWHTCAHGIACACGGEGTCSHAEPGWTPSQEDVDLGRQLTRERFGAPK